MQPTAEENRLEREARITAWKEHFAELLTEPLKLRQLADLFEVPSKKMGVIVRHIDGAVRVDRLRWRVPLCKMPPAYHIQAGLIPLETLGSGPFKPVRAA